MPSKGKDGIGAVVLSAGASVHSGVPFTGVMGAGPCLSLLYAHGQLNHRFCLPALPGFQGRDSEAQGRHSASPQLLAPGSGESPSGQTLSHPLLLFCPLPETYLSMISILFGPLLSMAFGSFLTVCLILKLLNLAWYSKSMLVELIFSWEN